MSCEYRRKQFLGKICGGDPRRSAGLESLYQSNYGPASSPLEAIENQAKTLSLFLKFQEEGIELPVHSADGLPKTEAQRGYAALWDFLAEVKKVGSGRELAPPLIMPTLSSATLGTPTLYDKYGFDKEGFNRLGFNREGYSKSGHISGIGSDMCGPDGKNRYGFDKHGYDKNGRNWLGFDPAGLDPQGYNRFGFDARGYDKDGFNIMGLNNFGRDRAGYDRFGYDPGGYDHYGFHKSGFGDDGFNGYGYDQAGYDKDGYNINGYNQAGYDRAGYDQDGYTQNQDRHRFFSPDNKGFYGDGYDVYGYDKNGYNEAGFNRWGFNTKGFNTKDLDCNGFSSSGFGADGRDTEGYDKEGYNKEGYDRLGYDKYGINEKSGRSILGFDRTGYDKDGYDYWGVNKRGLGRDGRKCVSHPCSRSGYDNLGYNRQGFNVRTGFTADGRNYAGWIYDNRTKDVYNPDNPKERMRHKYALLGAEVYPERPHMKYKPRKLRPGENLTFEEYIRIYPGGSKEAYEAVLNPVLTDYSTAMLKTRLRDNWARSSVRAALDPQAVYERVYLRCTACGQYCGGEPHQCPKFKNHSVSVYRSGLGGTGKNQGWAGWQVFRPGDDYGNRGAGIADNFNKDGVDFDTANRTNPYAPGCSDTPPSGRDPRFMFGGFDKPHELGRDKEGYDPFGFDREGYDFMGYGLDGFNRFGFASDGFDRWGYDKNGLDAEGNERPNSLRDFKDSYDGVVIKGDLLANEGLRRMYEQMCSGLVGKPRKVVFTEGGGFATDMDGTILLDPYPLGRSAPPENNIAVTTGGLYHELGHEHVTPIALWRKILDIAHSPDPTSGLDGGRRILGAIYNIIEDGRMERQISARWPGVAEALALSCRLQSRWDQRVGGVIPPGFQAQGAILYEALPFFRVADEILAKMSPKAREAFEGLRPVVRRGVLGEPIDAFNAAIDIAKRFEELGFTDIDPKLDYRPPRLPNESEKGGDSDDTSSGQESNEGQEGNTEGQSGEQESGKSGKDKSAPGSNGGSGQSGETEKEAAGKSQNGNSSGAGEASEQGGEGRSGSGTSSSSGKDEGRKSAQNGSGSKEKGDQSEKGDNSTSPQNTGGSKKPPSLTDMDVSVDPDALTKTLAALERDAAQAIKSDVKRQVSSDNLGAGLHAPLGSTSNNTQVYSNASGIAVGTPVFFPCSPDLVERWKLNRANHQKLATRLYDHLSTIRDETERILNHQTRGSFDRRGIVRAMKDQPDVYKQTKEVTDTSLVASINVDLSGSMQKEKVSGGLFDAASVIGDTLELLDAPYEVRGFDHLSYQFKSMGDPTFEPNRSVALTSSGGGSTCMSATAGLAITSLFARPEKNRLMVCLTDGDLGDHSEVVKQMRDARQKKGIVTFGVYLTTAGSNPDKQNMDDLYGRGNWVAISKLLDLPKVVGARLEELFLALRQS